MTKTPDTMVGRSSMEGMPYKDQPKIIADVTTYTLDQRDEQQWSGKTTVDLTDYFYDHRDDIASLGLAEDGSTDPDEAEKSWGGEAIGFSDPSSGADYLYDDTFMTFLHDVELGAGGNDIDITGALGAYFVECRDRRLIPFSDTSGHRRRERNHHEAHHEAQRKASLETAREAISMAAAHDVLEKNPIKASTLAARSVYLDVARVETQAAIDRLVEWGRERGAGYVTFPGDDDTADGSLLSVFPVFYSEDGFLIEDEGEQNGPEWDDWAQADRTDAVVSELRPSLNISDELDSKRRELGATPTDLLYVYRCTKEK